jgi:hypothetical protein
MTFEAVCAELTASSIAGALILLAKQPTNRT